jgi:ribosomal protein S17
MTMRTSVCSLLLVVVSAAGTAAARWQTPEPARITPDTPRKTETFRGEVIHSDAQRIVVRSRENPRIVRTFTYAPALKKKMEALHTKGGFQFGDRVQIQHEAGRDVALAIKGKPSAGR